MNSQAIFCVTSKGVELALKINEKFESDIFVLEKFVVEKTISFNSLNEIVKKNFFRPIFLYLFQLFQCSFCRNKQKNYIYPTR